MKEEKYSEICHRLTNFLDTDEEISKFNNHQKINLLWHIIAVIINAHYECGHKEELRPLLDLIKKNLKEWKELEEKQKG